MRFPKLHAAPWLLPLLSALALLVGCPATQTMPMGDPCVDALGQSRLDGCYGYQSCGDPLAGDSALSMQLCTCVDGALVECGPCVEVDGDAMARPDRAQPAYCTGDDRGEPDPGVDTLPSEWERELATQIRDQARDEGLGTVVVAGPGAGRWACVGAWALGGAAVGEATSKGCVAVGVVTSASGAGGIAAIVCGVSDITQLDAVFGYLGGAAVGLATCSGDTPRPTTTVDEPRTYTTDRPTTCAVEFTAEQARTQRALRDYVYRGLRAADVGTIAAGQGIIAKNPSGSWSLLEHVRRGSQPDSEWSDPWISTSRDPLVALSFDRNNRGVVVVDRARLTALGIRNVDVFDAIPRGGTTPADLEMVRSQQEIAVYQRIPQAAIVGFMRRLGNGRFRLERLSCP